MTDRFKEVWEEFVKRNGEQGFFAEAIREALTLATESEQLRKERDDYKQKYETGLKAYQDLLMNISRESE